MHFEIRRPHFGTEDKCRNWVVNGIGCFDLIETIKSQGGPHGGLKVPLKAHCKTSLQHHFYKS